MNDNTKPSDPMPDCYRCGQPGTAFSVPGDPVCEDHRLYEACATVIGDDEIISTVELLSRLQRRWPEMPATALELAKGLAVMNIHPSRFRVKGERFRGYRRTDFPPKRSNIIPPAAHPPYIRDPGQLRVTRAIPGPLPGPPGPDPSQTRAIPGPPGTRPGPPSTDTPTNPVIPSKKEEEEEEPLSSTFTSEEVEGVSFPVSSFSAEEVRLTMKHEPLYSDPQEDPLPLPPSKMEESPGPRALSDTMTRQQWLDSQGHATWHDAVRAAHQSFIVGDELIFTGFQGELVRRPHRPDCELCADTVDPDDGH